jgi:hypothetical protein
MGDLEPKVQIGSALLRGAISQLPVLGPVITELLSQAIPDRRIERLNGLFERLEQRVSALEPQVVRDRFSDSAFSDIVEDGMFSAARASSSERLDWIAELLARGIEQNDLEKIDRKYLLALLGQLNDAEVIVLCSHGIVSPGKQAEFYGRHQGALDLPYPSMADAREVHARQAVRESYRTHLEALGLLQREYHFLRNGQVPEFERDGRLKGGTLGLSPLGWVFLREIGHPHELDDRS